jgi:hypothetical protein
MTHRRSPRRLTGQRRGRFSTRTDSHNEWTDQRGPVSSSSAALMSRGSRLATSGARTSPCGWVCGVTPLTNGCSKEAENPTHRVSLRYMHYNFARTHQSLKGQTPPMAVGVDDHAWSVTQIAGLLAGFVLQ